MTLKSTLKAAVTVATLAIGFASQAQAAEVRCDSRYGNSNYCRVDTAGGVTLRHQHTRARCDLNDTWGYDRHGIWVANGCSATFRIGRDDEDEDNAAAIGLGILALGILGAVASNDDGPRDYPPSSPPPGGYPPGGYPPSGGYDDDNDYDDPYADAQIISCDSKNYKFRFCGVRVDQYAELVRQRSRNACRYGKTWGYDRRGVWVKKGCRADFAIY
jgi:hypothetical protein